MKIEKFPINSCKLFLWVALTVLLIACSSSSVTTAGYPNPLPAYPNTGCDGVNCPKAGADVALSGIVSVIQNGQITYMIFDDQGDSWELLIDEGLLTSVGGTQILNGKHVTIFGKWTADIPAKIQVASIKIIQH